MLIDLRPRAMWIVFVWVVVGAMLADRDCLAAEVKAPSPGSSAPGSSAPSDDEAAVGYRDAEVLFVRRVATILHEKCVACHGADTDDIQGGLDLRSHQTLMTGGDSGQPSVVAGDAVASPLFLAATWENDDWAAMPPKESERLTPEQLDWLCKWIDAGAPWPGEQRVAEIEAAHADKWSAEDGVAVTTSGGLSPEWTQRKYRPEGLWGYRKVTKPSVESPDRAIDELIERRMPAGLAAAPPADRRTLIRRATFDLIGLPPEPQEVIAFVSDPAPDHVAFARVVDRLLDSPHYGERMAQHWLDVVRYADSSGFANDYERGNAWRYRDYVVRAMNEDKPYDQFVIEQIAGDEVDPENPEGLIATGFLRMGPWELTGMEVAKVARQRFLDDVTNAVGETFLAHSLQCARCHDHKFDPIPTRDYYSVQAVFATTQLTERRADFLPVENRNGFDEVRFLEKVRADHVAVLERLDAQLLVAAEMWFEEAGVDPSAWRLAVEQARKQSPAPQSLAQTGPDSAGGRGKRHGYSDLFASARSILMRQKVPEDQFPPKNYGFSPQDYGDERVARKGLERLGWEIDRYAPYALAVYNGRTPELRSVNSPRRVPADRITAGELEQPCILVGGDPFSVGEPVEPATLSVLGDLSLGPIPDHVEGRRSALAFWVASEDNPLTTRAIVNRLWLWHFNQPIAGNPNNFGATGKPPTHPELLDWLAATLVENNWSIKAMHRVMMNSDVYRRSSTHPDAARVSELDPLATSFATFRPRRLTAEELRDAMLAATGELNPTLGGIPNRPEINLEAALQPRQVMGTFAAAWVPNPLPQQRHRRSIYSLKLRGLIDPMLEVFNAPSPDFSCEGREASTVTPQVFSLFNGLATHARALSLADRAIRETSAPADSLRLCFELVYGRPATPEETDACLRHWQEMTAYHSAAEPRRPAELPLVVRREAVEENTGEKFAFDETLHAYAEFVPDLQPGDVDAATRGLAEVCLVLLNSNEFVYIY